MTDFGRDTLCIGELKTGRYATGRALIAQRLFHALSTPRGVLQGDEIHANWGDCLTDCVGMPGGAVAEAAIRAKVNRAASNDDAILSATTTIASAHASDGTWSHAVTVDAKTAEGPFRLVIPSINDVTVATLGYPQESNA